MLFWAFQGPRLRRSLLFNRVLTFSDLANQKGFRGFGFGVWPGPRKGVWGVRGRFSPTPLRTQPMWPRGTSLGDFSWERPRETTSPWSSFRFGHLRKILAKVFFRRPLRPSRRVILGCSLWFLVDMDPSWPEPRSGPFCLVEWACPRDVWVRGCLAFGLLPRGLG
jgi:hypothetical protein